MNTLQGLDRKSVTLKIAEDSKMDMGMVVNFTGNNTVDVMDAGDAFCGVCMGIDGSFATIVIRGEVATFYDGTAPSVGYCKLSTAASGYMKVDATDGREYLVASVDSSTNTISILL